MTLIVTTEDEMDRLMRLIKEANERHERVEDIIRNVTPINRTTARGEL